jgi:hypothetical protein
MQYLLFALGTFILIFCLHTATSVAIHPGELSKVLLKCIDAKAVKDFEYSYTIFIRVTIWGQILVWLTFTGATLSAYLQKRKAKRNKPEKA